MIYYDEVELVSVTTFDAQCTRKFTYKKLDIVTGTVTIISDLP